jgi:hypothetical protein
MSYGYSAGEFVGLVRLAHRTYRNCQKAGDEYFEIARETRKLHGVLRILRTESKSADSAVFKQDPTSAAELLSTIRGCQDVLEGIDAMLAKYNGLSPKNGAAGVCIGKKILHKIRFGSKFKQLGVIRSKLVTYTSTLSVLLHTMQLKATGRLGTQLENGFAELRGNFELIRKEVLSTVTQERAMHGYESLLSLSSVSTFDGDNKETWISLRQELIRKGFWSKTLDRHKEALVAYMMELEKSGLPDKATQASGASRAKPTSRWTKRMFMETTNSLPDPEFSEGDNPPAENTIAVAPGEHAKARRLSPVRPEVIEERQKHTSSTMTPSVSIGKISQETCPKVCLDLLEETNRVEREHLAGLNDATEYGTSPDNMPVGLSIYTTKTAKTSNSSTACSADIAMSPQAAKAFLVPGEATFTIEISTSIAPSEVPETPRQSPEHVTLSMPPQKGTHLDGMDPLLNLGGANDANPEIGLETLGETFILDRERQPYAINFSEYYAREHLPPLDSTEYPDSESDLESNSWDYFSEYYARERPPPLDSTEYPHSESDLESNSWDYFSEYYARERLSPLDSAGYPNSKSDLELNSWDYFSEYYARERLPPTDSGEYPNSESDLELNSLDYSDGQALWQESRAKIEEMTKSIEEFRPSIIKRSDCEGRRLPWPRNGILRTPTPKFPEDPNPIRHLVAVSHAKERGLPSRALWTKIPRRLVSPKALDFGGMRYEIKDDYVIVLQALSKKCILEYAALTKAIEGKCLIKAPPLSV